LGRELSDDEFDASFDNIDEDKDGLIQFNEFLTWYNAQTAAEQKKIRALKVEAELRRRLASGELTPEQSKTSQAVP
jgi:Ca2+-binding EF-hand superfamily protein